jgi:hypothetical protein
LIFRNAGLGQKRGVGAAKGLKRLNGRELPFGLTLAMKKLETTLFKGG